MSIPNNTIKEREKQASIADFVRRLSLMKHEAMVLGLFRTGHLIDIPIQEVGWEMQGKTSPGWQKDRQQKTLAP